ncbi:MAG: hypothetical protein R3Y22_08595 [Bacteroidales bacterium]
MNQEVLQIILVLVVLALYIYLLARLRHRVTAFRNYFLLPVTALLGFGVYFAGYYALGDDGVVVNVILAIFSTVEMVVLKSDIVGIAQSCRDSELYMFLFGLAHAMAIVLIATTVLSIWGKRLTTKIMLRINRKKRSYILFDVNEEAMTLATDLLKNDKRRLVIFVSEDNSKTTEIERMGAYYIDSAKSRNRVGGSSLFSNIVSSNSELFYISNNESKNMNGALQMLSLLKKLPKDKLKIAEESIDMHIRIASEDMQQVFMEARKAQGVNLNFSIFNEADIIATQLINNYPPVSYIKPDTDTATATVDYDIMIIGFGKRGRAILRKTIEFGQFIGSTYRATIVDVAIKQKIGSFNATYPAVTKCYDIDTFDGHASSDDFFELLRNRSSSLKQIIISLSTDNENIKRAIEIHKILTTLKRTDIDIIVVTHSEDDYDYMHTSNNFASLHCIGRNNEIYTEEIIVNDAIAAKAVVSHNYYNAKKRPEKRQEWRTLSSHKQQSNISASLHIPTKLALMGLTAEELQQFAANEKYLDFLRSNKERYDNLARTEHLRWNAFHYVRGWQQWELSNENCAGKPTGDEIRKLHICLVEWDALGALDTHQGQEVGTYQGYDYDNSDNIWESPEQ